MPESVVKLEQYVFSCEAVPMPDGQSGAMVMIRRATNGVRVISRRFPDAQRFATPEAALAHAGAWAVEWIRRYGVERHDGD